MARWQPGANREAFIFDADELFVAATLAAAEFQVARSFDAAIAENYLFKVSTSAGAQITGRRRGHQLGLISFLVPAGKCDKAEFDGLMITRKRRGF